MTVIDLEQAPARCAYLPKELAIRPERPRRPRWRKCFAWMSSNRRRLNGHHRWFSCQNTTGGGAFAFDYRRLNALSLKDSYPLLQMDECIDSLEDAKFFITPDYNWGF